MDVMNDKRPDPNVWCNDHIINDDGTVSPIRLTPEELQERVEWCQVELESRHIRREHNVSMVDFYLAYKEAQ